MSKICAIIEARTSSTRLPGKVLLKIKKKTVLEYLINQLKKVNKIDQIIVATTLNKEDDQIIGIAKKLKVNFYRGDEDNVLQRVIKAAKSFRANIIVRITSDCPLVDLELIDQFIEIYLKNDFDIVTNAHHRSYPDGMDIEVIKSKSLIKSYKYAINKYLREHTTLSIYKHKNLFKICNIIAPHSQFFPELGLTLDEYKDFVLIKKIISYIIDKKKITYSCKEIIDLLHRKGWKNINKSVKRVKHKYLI